MNRNTLILLAVFVLGCAAGMHADSRAYAQPKKAHQQFPAPTTVRKWQQFCSDHAASGDEVNRIVRERGAEGWELVSVTPHQEVFKSLLLCFKRPAD